MPRSRNRRTISNRIAVAIRTFRPASGTKQRSSKSSELSPNAMNSTYGSGSRITSECEVATSIKVSRTRSTSAP